VCAVRRASMLLALAALPRALAVLR